VLAATTPSYDGKWQVPDEAATLRRLADGRLAASCGLHAAGLCYIDWLEASGDKDKRPKLPETTVIVIELDGKVRVHEENGDYTVTGPYHAWGSGLAPALGALMMGADAVRAVEIAGEIDPYSAGPVVSERSCR